MKTLKFYLAETVVVMPWNDATRLEPVGIYSSKAKAMRAMGKKPALITELVVNETFASGIGAANHWHLNDEE